MKKPKSLTSKRYDCECGRITISAAIAPYCRDCGSNLAPAPVTHIGNPGRKIEAYIGDDE